MDAAARGEEWVRRTAETPAPQGVPAPAWRRPDGTPTSLLLLRHGQTALSVDRRFSGIGDPPLTDIGRAQAAALAARVRALAAPPPAVWTSPLRRAYDTATAVAGALGVEPRVDERLRECDFGEWEGLTFGEIQERAPAALAAWLGNPAVAAPGGESFAAVTTRVRQARDAIVAAHPGEPVAVVSHVTPVKVLLGLALGAPDAALYRLHLDLASLSQADWYADGHAIVRRVNDTAHLDGPPFVM
jgi:probable phosphoglycerate mutase